MSCGNDCERPDRFPATIHNRPGLPRIDYRIGDYASFREHLLRQLDLAGPLQEWSHRGADDPAIALLEGTALVAEVIAFYQSLYANEAFLRTAAWRDSVSRLVQLTGYRLAPGIGGEATFALLVTGSGPVTVPAGFGVRVPLEGQDQAAVFESREESIAFPAQNAFRLHPPRGGPQPVAAGLTELELAAVDGERRLDLRQAQGLRAGDRLLLLPDDHRFDADGGAVSPGWQQAPAEILIVRETENLLDRVIVRFDGALVVPRGTRVRARLIGRSFRHFGHSAPARFGGEVDPLTGIQSIGRTRYRRPLDTDLAGEAGLYSGLAADRMLLDGEVDDLPAGADLICQGRYRRGHGGGTRRLTVTRRIRSWRLDSALWGGTGGSCTVIELDRPLIANPSLAGAVADLRQLLFHETLGPELILEAPRRQASGAFTGVELHYFGRYRDARDLSGRELMLRHDDGRLQTVTVTSRVGPAELAGRDRENDWMWPLQLSEPPLFEREAFDERAPRVMVYGNLLHAEQGESQPEVVLGSGDARQAFQTFALPRGPLTWLLRPEATPAQVPELTVYVDGLAWQQVEVLYGQGPRARVYVVREDDDGNSHVQFGDGVTGARLPSGRNNVVAVYRTGSGARGAAAGKASPTAGLTQLQRIEMPGPAVGGGDPETADQARQAAPQRLQSLDRLVGLSDYEAEALALPGVNKARAEWLAPSGVPLVRITVLTAGGDPADIVRVQQSLDGYNRCRGAARYPIRVRPGRRRWLYLSLHVGHDAAYRSDDLVRELHAILGVAGTGTGTGRGLFGEASRQLGQGAHLSQVLAAAQGLEGVTWARADAFQALDPGTAAGDDPLAIGPPAAPRRMAAIGCPGDAILALHLRHLVLLPVREAATGECTT